MPPTTRLRVSLPRKAAGPAAAGLPYPTTRTSASSSSSPIVAATKTTKTRKEQQKQRPLSQVFSSTKATISAMKAKSVKETADTPAKAKRTKKVKVEDPVSRSDGMAPPLPLLSEEDIRFCTTIAFSQLSFSLDQAKEHLVRADGRFAPLLQRIPLRVFEELGVLGDDGDGGGDDDVEVDDQPQQPRGIQDDDDFTASTARPSSVQSRDLNLFQTLVTSILGQQVSWLAARAILYKFTRLWFPELPIVPNFTLTPRDSLPFPSPLQVRSATEEALRSAGLSGQKVRYVSDIAQRFSDGRLDVRKIVQMEQQEVLQELIKIKGVGVWTAQMILIFALRKPDVLPVGDLGVQRGMVILWTSGKEGPEITSKKARPLPSSSSVASSTSDLPTMTVVQPLSEAALPAPPAPPPSPAALPLPPEANLTHSQLLARKKGQKAKGNVYLTPTEMESLARTWEPYRSVASVLMWALVDA